MFFSHNLVVLVVSVSVHTVCLCLTVGLLTVELLCQVKVSIQQLLQPEEGDNRKVAHVTPALMFDSSARVFFF